MTMAKKRPRPTARDRAIARAVGRETGRELVDHLSEYFSTSLGLVVTTIRMVDANDRVSFGWEVLKLIAAKRDARLTPGERGSTDPVVLALEDLMVDVEQLRKRA